MHVCMYINIYTIDLEIVSFSLSTMLLENNSLQTNNFRMSELVDTIQYFTMLKCKYKHEMQIDSPCLYELKSTSG